MPSLPWVRISGTGAGTYFVLALFDLLADAPHVKGMLIGHTHRNRIRRYGPTGKLPFVEVNNPNKFDTI